MEIYENQTVLYVKTATKIQFYRLNGSLTIQFFKLQIISCDLVIKVLKIL